MKYTEDMSPTEAYSWVSLLATSAIFACFYQVMTSNGYIVVDHSPGSLMEIFIGIIILTIMVHAVIAGVFAVKRKSTIDELIDELSFEPSEKDERDIEIERKGERQSSWFIYAAVNIIVFILLVEYTFPEGYEPPLSVIKPSHMFFALMSTLFVGDIIKRLSMVLEYRK